MSFILDALRRAETQRGYQPPRFTTEATLDNVADPIAARPTGRKIALAMVIAAAIAAVSLYLVRSPETAVSQRSAPTLATTPATNAASAPLTGVGANTPLAEVAQPGKREVRPLQNEVRRDNPPAVPTEAARPGTVTFSNERLDSIPDGANIRTLTNIDDSSFEQLPGYKELLLSGRAQLPVFHLDIHVYAAEPERRFVFVNNRKYREGAQLDEGGTVERITPTSVILNHRGHRFELQPD